MKIKYDKPKGQKIKRYGHGITDKHHKLWYDIKNKIWTDNPDFGKSDYSTHCKCKTIKSFKRMMKKHPILKDRAVWLNKYEGYDAYF